MKKNNQWLVEFKENSIFRMEESMRMIRLSLEQLDEQDIWKRPNTSSNSVGNLMLHLYGNISQYAISSLGNNPDVRVRDKEFNADGGYDKADLINRLDQVVNKAKEIISSTVEEEYLRSREVQGFTMSGIGVVIHVVEHLSYHTGQIAFWTKLIKDLDLGFYQDIDLNIKNEE